MKNKEVISAVIGTSFFAVPYIGLSFTLLPSLAIGVVAYGASELIFSNTKKNKLNVTKQNVNNILNEAKKQNDYLISIINSFENVSTRENLKEITTTINKIIDTIKRNPTKIKSIDNFFDYYLPILSKIVKRYDEIENQNLSSKEGKNFIKSADTLISEVNVSFKNVLSELYQSDIVDADAEMKVFNSMLKTDGLCNEIKVDDKEN